MTYETFEAACLWCLFGGSVFCVLLIVLMEAMDIIDRVLDFNQRRTER